MCYYVRNSSVAGALLRNINVIKGLRRISSTPTIDVYFRCFIPHHLGRSTVLCRVLLQLVLYVLPDYIRLISTSKMRSGQICLSYDERKI